MSQGESIMNERPQYQINNLSRSNGINFLISGISRASKSIRVTKIRGGKELRGAMREGGHTMRTREKTDHREWRQIIILLGSRSPHPLGSQKKKKPSPSKRGGVEKRLWSEA
jgi:hypothetical protein